MKKAMATLLICLFLGLAFLPANIVKTDNSYIAGFDKGVSWKPVVPMQKTTFVNYDDESYLDDYSYLAAIPTAVINSEDQLYSHPLMFYEDDIEPEDEKEITLYGRNGIDYFMEDWISYCGEQLDQMTLINVPEEKVDQWDSKEYINIEGENPYEIASQLALHDWSYSDNAVLAVIDEDFEKPDQTTSNKIEGLLNSCSIYNEPTFSLDQTNSLNPIYNEFTVDEQYKYLKAETWWDCLLLGPGAMIPTGDPDLQLYCQYEGGWMQAAAVSYWNVYWPAGHEYTHTHVYEPGRWKVGITDLPTQSNVPTRGLLGGLFTLQGSLIKALGKGVTYHVEITMYPGVDLDIPDSPPFGCRNAEFKLKWDNPSVNLGFSLIGPAGEVIYTAINESRDDHLEMEINQLGELLADESYSISVFALTDVDQPVDFEIEYSWEQEIAEKESDSLTSATEGAVLASILNAPLIYTTPSSLQSCTENVLYKLGVEDVYLVNIGGHLTKDTKNKIEDIANIKSNYNTPEEIYDAIRDITNRNDVIFSTIDPWTYWLFAELEPADQKEGALFIGPAACLAAHHGSPVILIDNHPRLSSAVPWHNEFWSRFSYDRYRYHVSVANMVFTGRRIYDFLKINDFDWEGPETIITVADQYDIGMPWDRIFPGVANSGRICGPPVDTSFWIQRSIFYPALIYENPALKQDTVKLINGSVSTRRFGIYFGKLGGLFTKNDPLITIKLGNFEMIRESGEEEFENPILLSYISYIHRFNERASKYYGAKYECANGDIPGETPTMNPIDQGSIKKYTGKDGAYFPDLTETEIIPFYLEKGGYDCAYSSALPHVVENLNKGVLMWVHLSHGVEPKGGATLFWNPVEGFEHYAKDKNQIAAKIGRFVSPALDDENPWRGYEWLLGSTEEPDTMTMDVTGILPFTNIHLPGMPATGQTWAVARKPIREFLNNIIPFIDPFEVDDLYLSLIHI